MTQFWHLFDFDGTLIKCDSTLPFAAELLRHRPWRLAPALLPATAVRLSREANTRQAAKCEFLGRLLRGLSIEAASNVAASVALKLQRDRQYVAMSRLEELTLQGNSVLVVSASPTVLLRAFFAGLPGVRVVGTDFEVVRGIYSGEVLGVPCFGSSKVSAIGLVLGAEPSIQECWSDSESDLPMMMLARRRYWVATRGDLERIQRLDPHGILVKP